MRRTNLKLGSAAVLAVATSVAGMMPADASPAPRQHRCATYDNLTEKVIDAGFTDVPPAGYTVGDLGKWHNQLISQSGEVLADAVGGSRVDFADGTTLLVYQWNTDTFKDGAVKEAGLTDGNALLTGEKISIPAVGISGRYRGMTGFRTFQATAVDGIYNSQLMLCS